MAVMRYVPYPELDGAPNLIVDGAATGGTTITLSHWPHAVCPPGLEADLSAQMAFAFLDRRDIGPDLVSNNHFDQDGLVGVFAMVDPEAARERRGLLIDVAGAGDFATYRSRDAARISMAIAACADPRVSPLDLGDGDYPSRVAILYRELLGRLPELCDKTERFRELWAPDDAVLEASEAAIASGRVTIEEVPALDLAVFTIPEDAPTEGGYRFASERVPGLHPMALCKATGCFTLLAIRGRSYELTYRYESWVQYRSRRPRPRVDLDPLTEELSAEEPGGATWVFEGAGGLTPRLRLTGADESALPPDVFRRRLEAFLAAGSSAWDPYSR